MKNSVRIELDLTAEGAFLDGLVRASGLLYTSCMPVAQPVQCNPRRCVYSNSQNFISQAR